MALRLEEFFLLHLDLNLFKSLSPPFQLDLLFEDVEFFEFLLVYLPRFGVFKLRGSTFIFKSFKFIFFRVVFGSSILFVITSGGVLFRSAAKIDDKSDLRSLSVSLIASFFSNSI